MERIEYDPEIDPSIRREREAALLELQQAEREKELTARIRLEIERYAAEKDEPAQQQPESDRKPGQEQEPEQEPEPEQSRESATRRDEKRARREEKRELKASRATERRKAVRSVFTGSILSSDRMRKMWPYLLGIAALMVIYITYTFHLQRLHLERQNLEREVRELAVEAVARTADRERRTRRSEIVRRLEENNIPLKEFPNPVKTIER